MFKGLQMNEDTECSIEEIKNFTDISRAAFNDTHSKSLNKLLSVKDKISIFKNINTDDLKTIIYDLKFIKYKLGDSIIKQNEASHEMFFIISGKCKVSHNSRDVGSLSPGEVFGEIGAIFNTKRNASVICDSEEVTVLSFSIDHNNMELCSHALAILYKNLASHINSKLEDINYIHALHSI